MRAAYCNEPGPADRVTVGDFPDPVPGPNDALVQVHACPVNHIDTMIRSGTFATELAVPFVIGRDLAGVRTDTGGRVWSHSMGYEGRPGACAERAAVPVDRLYPIPDGVDFAEVAATAHPAATAHLALVRHAQLRPKETVFVGGANGAVGSCLVALAVRLGARVIAAARTEEGRAYAVSLGADEVVGSTADIAGMRSTVDVHVDGSGVADLGMAVEQLAIGGRVVVIASGESARTSALPADFYTRDVSVLGFVISRASVTDLAESARTVYRLLADGFRVPIALRVPLSGAAKVHQLFESGAVAAAPGTPGARGRLIVDCVR